MATFTTFKEEALARYLVMFGKGELTGYSPIEGGIENSNYFVTLNDDDHYVLTIIEGHDFSEVPYFSKVMARLYQTGLPVAAPLTTLDGMSSTIFCGKPATLVPKLAGEHVALVTAEHCHAIGDFMARSHVALDNLGIERSNPYSLKWMQQCFERHRTRLRPEQSAQLEALIQLYGELVDVDLPRGVVHGDLFVDNALFLDKSTADDGTPELTGVIDFYHACNDLLIQDIAIAINDWCTQADQSIDSTRRAAIIEGYDKIRPLNDQELDRLPAMQKVSAARFALTRLDSGDPPLKDPEAMLRLASQLN